MIQNLEDDLVIIEPNDLNKMDLLVVEYFNCEKCEHFIYNCKSLLKTSNLNQCINFKNKWTKYQMINEGNNYSGDYNNHSDNYLDYGILNLSSSSESSIFETDVMNLISIYEFHTVKL